MTGDVKSALTSLVVGNPMRVKARYYERQIAKAARP